jgi:oligoendopeptidase F
MQTIHEENVACDKSLQILDQLSGVPVSEEWLLTWSDAMKPCSAAYMRALYHYYQNISDKTAKARFNYVRHELTPKVEAAYRKLVAKALTWEPTTERYKRVVDRLQADATTENAETSELEAQVSKLCDGYNHIISRQRVVLDEPVTMQMVASVISSEPDRGKRRHLWLQREKQMADDYSSIDELFLEAIGLRQQIAKSAGTRNYLEYSWLEKYRTDYTPDDCLHWLDDIRDTFSGVQQRFVNFLATRLEIDQFRPWDLDVTQTQGDLRHRFNDASYLQAIETAFRALSPKFADIVTDMAQKGHIDLMNRPNKAGGNFATILTPNSEPLVSCNGTGSLGDLRVMLHESGHAVHYAMSSRNALSFEAFPRPEICEFAAYTLQTLASEQLVSSGIISLSEMKEFKLFILSTVLQKFRNIDSIERFQYWLYVQANVPTAAELDEAWSRFQNDTSVNWSNHEQYRNKGWQQSTVFCQPFYSIEYVISWLSTLLFIGQWRENPEEMIARFERGLGYGRKRTVQETFGELGINFPFQKQEIKQAAAIFDQEFMQGLET